MNLERPAPDQVLAQLAESAGPSRKGKVRIFVIFDTAYDTDLYELLHAQSKSPDCAFTVIGGSRAGNRSEPRSGPSERILRDEIGGAEQVIIICGEHTESSPNVHHEWLVAIEAKKPYFLLWGRRQTMCTKPLGARPTDGIYGWCRQAMHDQIALNLRHASTHSEAKTLRREPPERALPSGPGDRTG